MLELGIFIEGLFDFFYGGWPYGTFHFDFLPQFAF